MLARATALTVAAVRAPLSAFPLRLAGALAVVPLVLFASLALAFRTSSQDLTYPNIRVAGRAVGGLHARDVGEAIRDASQARLDSEVTLRVGDQAWRRSLVDLGLGLDDRTVARSLDGVWAIGHRSTWREWWDDQVRLVRTGIDVPASFTVDRARARASIALIARAIDRQPVDADVVLAPAGDRYEVHVTPSKTGLRVDVEATIDAIMAAARLPDPGVIDVVLEVTRATIDSSDLGAANVGASALVDDPIVLVDPEDRARRFVLDAPTAHAMLAIGRPDGATGVTARLDAGRLREWIHQVGLAIARPAANPRLAVDLGRLVVVPGSPGRVADVEATAKRVEASLSSRGHAVDLAFAQDPAWVPASAVEDARAHADRAVSDPIVLVIPADGNRAELRVLPRADTVLTWLALPDTQLVPRDTSRLAPDARPRLEWGIDPRALERYLDQEVSIIVGTAPVEPRIAVVARADRGTAPGTAGLVASATFGLDGAPPPSDPVETRVARPRAVVALGPSTPSSAARTAVALGTAIAAAASSPTPGQATAMASPGVARATSTAPRPTATTIGAVAMPTATPTATSTGQPTPARFEAIVLPGRPGRTIDVEALARAIDQRLHEGQPTLAGIVVVPPTAARAVGAQIAPLVGSATSTTTATPTGTSTRTMTATRTPTASRTPTTTPATASVPVGTAIAVVPTSTVPATTPPTPSVAPARLVVVPIVDRPPQASSEALDRWARLASVLIGSPVVVEWSDGAWSVEPNDLVEMLRFGPVGGDAASAYLSRDGLLSAAERIGREASRHVDAPRDEAGEVLPVDVPRTAAGIWAAANAVGDSRRAEIAWVEEEPTPVRGASTPMPASGQPTVTRTPVVNPGPDRVPTGTVTPTATRNPA